jgi:hypothetical protein
MARLLAVVDGSADDPPLLHGTQVIAGAERARARRPEAGRALGQGLFDSGQSVDTCNATH